MNDAVRGGQSGNSGYLVGQCEPHRHPCNQTRSKTVLAKRSWTGSRLDDLVHAIRQYRKVANHERRSFDAAFRPGARDQT